VKLPTRASDIICRTISNLLHLADKLQLYSHLCLVRSISGHRMHSTPLCETQLFSVVVLKCTTLRQIRYIDLLVWSRLCANTIDSPNCLLSSFFNRSVDCWNLLAQTLKEVNPLGTFRKNLFMVDLSAFLIVGAFDISQFNYSNFLFLGRRISDTLCILRYPVFCHISPHVIYFNILSSMSVCCHLISINEWINK